MRRKPLHSRAALVLAEKTVFMYDDGAFSL
jgi:hypothetical protein